MAKSTIQYLIDNNLDPNTALYFNRGDLLFIINEGYEEITINKDRGIREEILNKEDIVKRIDELEEFVKRFECSLKN